MLAAEWRLSKQKHYLRRPEYWEESWRLEKTCCHSISSERPSANADVKNSAVPVDHRIKLKECEKIDKYLDLASELKKLWNMKVAIIPIVIGAFCRVTKGLLKGLKDLDVGGRVEIFQTKALFEKARILRRVLETWEDLLSLNLQWKTIS